jgi:two-component system, OmpR family, sensor histidine kinase TctE
VPPFVALALLLASYRVRRSLRPLRSASARASAIGPESIAIRLPETDVPIEALPLVIAVNRALDRLEQGFALQRRFTANAAHELRTPLTIITARLDTLEGNGQITALREEVARMNRLVEQLLCVARLDSLALDVSAKVDLRQLAEEVVGSMAHLALATGRTIALTGVEHEVAIMGNAAAIGDALRNLIENALAHTPPGTEVTVEVGEGGSLSVADTGPGIPMENRPRLFDRFWRGPGPRSGGAGLGAGCVLISGSTPEDVRAPPHENSVDRSLQAGEPGWIGRAPFAGQSRAVPLLSGATAITVLGTPALLAAMRG